MATTKSKATGSTKMVAKKAGAVEAAVAPVFTLAALGTDALASYRVAYADVPKDVQKQCGSNAKKDAPNNRNVFYKYVVAGAPTYFYYFQYKPNKNDTTTGIDVFAEDGRSYGNGLVDADNVLTWSLDLES